MNIYNAERYHDPTAHAALSAIEKEERALRAFRPIVYICSPYSGDVVATQPPHGDTAASPWNRGTSPSRRTCCFRSF